MSVVLLALLALILTRRTASAGHRFGLVDLPTSRKRHTGEVPLTGGAAILLLVLCAPFFGIDQPSTAGLVIACAVFATGLVDDLRHVPPAIRLLLHYGAGIALALFGGIAIHNVGNLLGGGDIPLLFLAVPLTALAVAGLCNAYNMIDGIDGLAAATALVPLTVLFILNIAAGTGGSAALLPWLVAIAVFLLFNLGNGQRLPRVFLGDNGSLLLGFTVTLFLVHHSQGEQAIIQPVTALWLVTVPLMDMLSTMLKRYLEGRPLMQADRSHLHHILQDMGLSLRQTLLALLACCVRCLAWRCRTCQPISACCCTSWFSPATACSWCDGKTSICTCNLVATVAPWAKKSRSSPWRDTPRTRSTRERPAWCAASF